MLKPFIKIYVLKLSKNSPTYSQYFLEVNDYVRYQNTKPYHVCLNQTWSEVEMLKL